MATTKTKNKLKLSFETNARISVSQVQDEYHATLYYEGSPYDKHVCTNRHEAEQKILETLEALGADKDTLERLEEYLDLDGRLKIVQNKKMNTTLNFYLF